MLSHRLKGLLALTKFTLALVLAFGFLVSAFIANFLEKQTYDQVNFPLYLLGVALAALLAHQIEDQEAMFVGSPSERWVAALRQGGFDAVGLMLVLFAIVFVTKDKDISRIFLGAFILFVFPLAVLTRRYASEYLARLSFKGGNILGFVLVGSPDSTKRMIPWCKEMEWLGLKVQGVVTPEGKPLPDLPFPVLGNDAALGKVLSENTVQKVILLESRRDENWVKSVAFECRRAGCRLLIYNRWEDYLEQPLGVVRHGDHTFFSPQDEPLQNPLNRVLKRALDVAVSLPVVLFVLPLLCLMVWVAQKIQSPGPVFFRQKRSGYNRAVFEILKFRTMHVRPPEVLDEARQATQSDPRIYSFGGFLRRSSLDEFPQFWNVLKGEMSVVGPRPHLLQHDDEFSRLVGDYHLRNFAKPGLTGHAQTLGLRGEITDHHLLRERIRLDLDYINRWSLLRDVVLIVKTVKVVLFPPKSAY